MATPRQTTTPTSGDLTPAANPDDPADINGIASSEAIEYSDETYEADDGVPEVILQEKELIVETLQSCGAFITAFGSNRRSLSHSEILDMYKSIAEGILTAAQTPKEHTVRVESTPFTTGFDILLSAYQSDVEAIQAIITTSNTEGCLSCRLILGI